MSKQILIIYKVWAEYLPRFVEEGKKRGMAVELGHWVDLTIETGTKSTKRTKCMIGDKDLREFDLVLVRGVGKHHEELTLLADYCQTHKIKLLERHLLSGNADKDHKSFEALKLSDAGVKYPKSFFGSYQSIIDYLGRNNQWPVVIKDTKGRKGRGAYLVKKLETARNIFKGVSKKNYLVQEYIENDGEYRVWVVGGRVIGAMKRSTRMGEFELVGMTGSSKKIEIDPTSPTASLGAREMIDLAVNAAEALLIDIAGIDMVRSKTDGKLYVLEVNRAPVFSVFERVTGINVVGEIMEWVRSEITG